MIRRSGLLDVALLQAILNPLRSNNSFLEAVHTDGTQVSDPLLKYYTVHYIKKMNTNLQTKP